SELDGVVEVAVLALVPHLHRATVTRALLSDPDALRIVAIRAERRGGAGADPFSSALVALLLFAQALTQRLEQLVPATERFDLALLLLRQRALAERLQPLRRHLR